MKKRITPVRATSLMSYYQVLENLGERQLAVLKAINEIEPCCDFDIAEHLNKPINTITPRRNELVHMNLIKESHTGVSQTGRKALFWMRIRR